MAAVLRPQVGWRFWVFWLLITGLGWPLIWGIGRVIGEGYYLLAILILNPLMQSVLSPQLRKWFRGLWLGYAGLFVGFEIIGRNYSNIVDLVAVVIISTVLGLVLSIIVPLIVEMIFVGPIWLVLAFASLICPAERAKWRGKLSPSISKLAVSKSTVVEVALFVATAVLGSLANLMVRNLGTAVGWLTTGAELNLIARATLGMIYGVITGIILARLLHRSI